FKPSSRQTASRSIPPFSAYDRRDSSIRASNSGLLARETASQSEPDRSRPPASGLPFRLKLTGPSLARSAPSGTVRAAVSSGTACIARSPCRLGRGKAPSSASFCYRVGVRQQLLRIRPLLAEELAQPGRFPIGQRTSSQTFGLLQPLKQRGLVHLEEPAGA